MANGQDSDEYIEAMFKAWQRISPQTWELFWNTKTSDAMQLALGALQIAHPRIYKEIRDTALCSLCNHASDDGKPHVDCADLEQAQSDRSN